MRSAKPSWFDGPVWWWSTLPLAGVLIVFALTGDLGTVGRIYLLVSAAALIGVGITRLHAVRKQHRSSVE